MNKCIWDYGWAKCNKPTSGLFCEEHDPAPKCVACGNVATHGCSVCLDYGVCGHPLCDTCKHESGYPELDSGFIKGLEGLHGQHLKKATISPTAKSETKEE